jgi:diaminopimelate decarboxylase
VFGYVKAHARRLARDVAGPRLRARLPQRVDLPHDAFGLRVGTADHLHLGAHDLVGLVREFGSPLHVVDGSRLDAYARAAVGTRGAPERCDVYYSYKTNPIPAVLARLHHAGIGAEVISAYELWLAMRLGVPPERIIYNGPAKSTESLRLAIDRGIHLINANSASEAGTILGLAGEIGRPVRLGLRVSLPGMWGGQFGVSSHSSQVDEVVRRSLGDPMAKLLAIHAHRGDVIRSRDHLVAHVTRIVGFLEGLRDRTGWYPEIVDIGGSLACATVGEFTAREYRMNRLLGTDILPPDPSAAIDVADASAVAARMVREHAAALGERAPQVVIEPGRALTANTQVLLTSVVDVKNDADLRHAVLDAGINIADSVAHEYHQLFSASNPLGSAEIPYRLVGPICTPADVLYNNWRLPDLQPGHVLAIMDAGAYFVPFSTEFSFPRPAIVMIEGDAVKVVRRREQFDDLVRLDVVEGVGTR